jgi:uncharacterized membrane protein YgdD (TMEM256/DUF423 family)
MNRRFVAVAAVLGALGVGLGAFGAHGLADLLEANGRAATFDTATQYLLIHALALLFAATSGDKLAGHWATRAGWLFVLGAIFFSGSLYTLAIFNLSFMGAVAPLGGTALIAGWLCVGVGAFTTGE